MEDERKYEDLVLELDGFITNVSVLKKRLMDICAEVLQPVEMATGKFLDICRELKKKRLLGPNNLELLKTIFVSHVPAYNFLIKKGKEINPELSDQIDPRFHREFTFRKLLLRLDGRSPKESANYKSIMRMAATHFHRKELTECVLNVFDRLRDINALGSHNLDIFKDDDEAKQDIEETERLLAGLGVEESTNQTKKESVLKDKEGEKNNQKDYPKSYEYKSGQKGFMAILNWTVDREGATTDESKIWDFFMNKLNWDTEVKRDLGKEDLQHYITDLQKRFQSVGFAKKYYFFGMFVIAHGKGVKTIYVGKDHEGEDQYYKLQTLFDQFKIDKIPSLLGKPRFFLIQCCRGNKLQSIFDEAPESDDEKPSLPKDSDIHISYATTEGNAAVRLPDIGSWFICEALGEFENYRDHHMEDMLIVARYNVATKYRRDEKGQMPCCWSTFTKHLFFTSAKI